MAPPSPWVRGWEATKRNKPHDPGGRRRAPPRRRQSGSGHDPKAIHDRQAHRRLLSRRAHRCRGGDRRSPRRRLAPRHPRSIRSSATASSAPRRSSPSTCGRSASRSAPASRTPAWSACCAAASRGRWSRCAPTWTRCRSPRRSTCRSRRRRAPRTTGEDVGVMHACGHDTHIAILMGVAEVLSGLRAGPARHREVHLPARRGKAARQARTAARG